jgi:hypothetical protein
MIPQILFDALTALKNISSATNTPLEKLTLAQLQNYSSECLTNGRLQDKNTKANLQPIE